jgi:hypothetical protein
MFHLSRASISIVYAGGKINFESSKSLDVGEDPVVVNRIMDTDRQGGYLEFETGLNEPRRGTLTVQNVPSGKLSILNKLFSDKEVFNISVVDTKSNLSLTLSKCVFEKRPQQQTIDSESSFDVMLSVIYVKLEQ